MKNVCIRKENGNTMRIANISESEQHVALLLQGEVDSYNAATRGKLLDSQTMGTLV